MKAYIKLAVLLAVLAPLVYFFPIPTRILILCGLYDLLRNRKLNFRKFIR